MKKSKGVPKIDMTGQVYNSWKILELVPHTGEGKKPMQWLAECLECNEIYTVKGYNVRYGLSKRCVKCGCGHGHNLQKGQIRTQRTLEESIIHYLFLDLRKASRRRNLEWSLTEEDVKKLIFGNCHYCGIKPSFKCNPLKHKGLSQSKIKESNIVRNGIDRVDSLKGYIKDNVVTACNTCNLAKLDCSTEEFMDWVKQISNHMFE